MKEWPQYGDQWDKAQRDAWDHLAETQEGISKRDRCTYAVPCPACGALVTSLIEHGVRTHVREDE